MNTVELKDVKVVFANTKTSRKDNYGNDRYGVSVVAKDFEELDNVYTNLSKEIGLGKMWTDKEANPKYDKGMRFKTFLNVNAIRVFDNEGEPYEGEVPMGSIVNMIVHVEPLDYVTKAGNPVKTIKLNPVGIKIVELGESVGYTPPFQDDESIKELFSF